MATSKIAPPPKHLDAAGKQLWRDILAAFDIAEPHHLALLCKACEQQDRVASYRVAIDDAGPSTIDRFGQLRPNPLLAEERAASNLLRLCLRELNLDSVEPDSLRLPRGIRYGAR